MPQFVLRIKLGNDAMQTPYDIQEALKRVSKRIYDADFNLDDMRSGCTIMDLNGNTVGSWQIK